jgi:ribosome maturation protein Sdo1
MLENEFGTSNDDEAVLKILEKGSLQEFEMVERQGRKNDSNGSYIGR